MKICTKCKIEKPLDAFRDLKRGKYGKQSICKECISIEGKALRANYPKISKDEKGLIKPPEKIKFDLEIGDKVKFIKSWETEKAVGIGIVESISKWAFVVWTGKYRVSFGFNDKVQKVGQV